MPKSRRNQIGEHRLERRRIEFLVGPVPPSIWPKPYESWFLEIRDIGRTFYDDYGKIAEGSIRSVTEDRALAAMKDKVFHLNQIGNRCRREGQNERGWIQNVELEVFSRLKKEVVCRVCRKYRWQAEFPAVPLDLADLEHLVNRGNGRGRCECTEMDRAACDRYDAGEACVFSDRADERIQLAAHEPGRRQSAKRPDGVYGLAMTLSFAHYVKRRETLKHSPFPDYNPLYPFLIVEAKSEKSEDGFVSIEQQSAASLKECLDLQLQLTNETGVPLSPLVWFVGYRGDEWRLYAAVPHSGKIKVIDLWHGNVLSQDGALQIFLIVDHICDWARKIYRPRVLECLAGGATYLREFTPAHTTMSPQEDGTTSVREASAALDEMDLSDNSDTDLEGDVDGDSMMQFDLGCSVALIQTPSPRPASFDVLLPLSHTEACSYGVQWKRCQCAPLRTRLLRKQIRIPEDPGELLAFLQVVYPEDDPQIASRALLDSLVNHEFSITVESENLWRRQSTLNTGDDSVKDDDSSSEEENDVYWGDNEFDVPVRLTVCCITSFDPYTSQCTQLILYTSCTQSAAAQLAILSQGGHALINAPQSWTADECEAVRARIEDVARWAPRYVLAGAVTSEALYLAPIPSRESPRSYRWTATAEYENIPCSVITPLLKSEGHPNVSTTEVGLFDNGDILDDGDKRSERDPPFKSETSRLAQSWEHIPGVLFESRNFELPGEHQWCYTIFNMRISTSTEATDMVKASLERGRICVELGPIPGVQALGQLQWRMAELRSEDKKVMNEVWGLKL